MKKSQRMKLSAGELMLMQMLWEQGGVTLSQAHRAMLDLEGTIGYTTIQTRLDRLVSKGAARKTEDRPGRYEAVMARDDVSKPLLSMLLERVTGAVPLVANLVKDPSVTAEDLRAMKKLISEAEESRRR